ncbi:MAG TPA: P-loop NTPase [Gemmatimonadaceae bacterium]|nr:P-loop NTPase [Gemmatimonadaceae bacterium]
MTTLQERLASALAAVKNPRTGSSVVDDEMVRDVGTSVDGRVRLTMMLSPHDDAELVRDVRHALEAVPGVRDVLIDVKPKNGPPPRAEAPPSRPAASRMLPVMDARPPTPKAVPAPTPVAYPHLGSIVAVSSGKGGVGKSTIAVNLAVTLAQRGARVGLMDADVYGPNVPRMIGVDRPPAVQGERIIPLEAHGIKVISLGFLIERDQPAIWRGPIVMKIVTQFLRDVSWGELDYFLVDMPPGTGDAQLSLAQATHVHGALIVTTPQDVAVGDALRGVKMFQRVNIPVLGIVENMSWFECPHCGKPSALFGSGGGERLASEVELPLLAQIPLAPRVMEGGDRGVPIVVSDPESAAARAIAGLADRVSASLAAAS